jgi:hypothetical protein
MMAKYQEGTYYCGDHYVSVTADGGTVVPKESPLSRIVSALNKQWQRAPVPCSVWVARIGSRNRSHKLRRPLTALPGACRFTALRAMDHGAWRYKGTLVSRCVRLAAWFMAHGPVGPAAKADLDEAISALRWY